MITAAKLVKVSQIKLDSKSNKWVRVKIFELNPVNSLIPNFLAYKEEKVRFWFLPRLFKGYWANPTYIGCWNNLNRCINYLETEKGYNFNTKDNDK